MITTYKQINTILVSDTKYVEVAEVNGEIKTYVNEKVSEPNEFKSIEILDGDQSKKFENTELSEK